MKIKDRKIVSIYFGVPGSGKSTFAAAIARRFIRHNYPVYCNFPIVGTYEYDVKDLGKFQIEDCKLIIDEAGLEFNNRAFKSFTNEQLLFFKLHRHYGVSIDVFSQTYNDMDKKIRDLAQRLYIVRRSLIPFHVVCIPIRRSISINEQTKEITDAYSIDNLLVSLFTAKRCFMPLYWKYFDSYSAPELTRKEWKKYEKKNIDLDSNG